MTFSSTIFVVVLSFLSACSSSKMSGDESGTTPEKKTDDRTDDEDKKETPVKPTVDEKKHEELSDPEVAGVPGVNDPANTAATCSIRTTMNERIDCIIEKIGSARATIEASVLSSDKAALDSTLARAIDNLNASKGYFANQDPNVGPVLGKARLSMANSSLSSAAALLKKEILSSTPEPGKSIFSILLEINGDLNKIFEEA